MKVKEWMTSELITVPREKGLNEAWDLMQRRRIRHLLVMDGPRLVGIVSDRDIRLVLPSPATSLSGWEVTYLLNALTVDRVMTRSPVTIEPDRPLSEAAALMLEYRIGALPVADARGVRGIITQTDVLRAFPPAPVAPAAVAAPATPAIGPRPSRTILVPLDRQGREVTVLTAARELARQVPAVLRLLYVAPPPESVVVGGRTVSYSDQEAARAEWEAVDDLRATAAEVAADVPVEFAVSFGDPAEEIVRETESANVDLIVMATHRRTGVRRLLQGSVAEAVERATKLPVLLVPYERDSGEEEPSPTALGAEIGS
jgi:CBS domain-containing protein